jgi:hypothetical protein
MLSNYQKRRPRLSCRSSCSGQPEFRDKLAGSESLEQLRQRVIATHHLEPMGENEIEGYITHRLAQAGAEGRPEFERSLRRNLSPHGGRAAPREPVRGRLLLYGAVEQLDSIDADAVAAVAADLAPMLAPKVAGRARAPAPQRSPRRRPEQESDPMLRQRLEELEARLEEQEAALRRVLTLLVDWVETTNR